jgi:hypothetical protein
VSLLSRILCPVIDGCHFQDLAPVSFAPIVELALLARAASRSLQSPIQKDSLVAMKQLIHGTDYDKSQRQRERERERTTLLVLSSFSVSNVSFRKLRRKTFICSVHCNNIWRTSLLCLLISYTPCLDDIPNMSTPILHLRIVAHLECG